MESQGGVASIVASLWELSHPREPVWRPGFQERLGCPNSGYGCLGRHLGCLDGVKLVLGLHHVSQGGDQGKFLDGEASVWASPCEFQW